MLLLNSKAVQAILDRSIILLDSTNDIPVQSDVVTVVFKGNTEYDPCTRIIAGCDASAVTRVVLTTLDVCTKTEFPTDLIGVGALGDERLRGACQHPSEIVASVIWNVTQYQRCHGADAVHVDACQHAVAGEGYTIVVHSLFDEHTYAPQISIVNESNLIYQGDPGNVIMFNDKGKANG